MKNKYILAIFLFGLVITIIGALFKIMHWPFASAVLTIGLSSEAVAIALFIMKAVQNGRSNNFGEK